MYVLPVFYLLPHNAFFSLHTKTINNRPFQRSEILENCQVCIQVGCLQLWCDTMGAGYLAAAMGRHEPNASRRSGRFSIQNVGYSRRLGSSHHNNNSAVLAEVHMFLFVSFSLFNLCYAYEWFRTSLCSFFLGKQLPIYHQKFSD